MDKDDVQECGRSKKKMTFALTLLLLLIMRLAWTRVLPWRPISVSTVNLIGTLLYIALGLEYMQLTGTWQAILMVLIFYFFLLVGEYYGRRIPLDEANFARLGELLRHKSGLILWAIVFFGIYSSLPLATALASGQSITEMLSNIWASYGIAARSSRLVEWLYTQQNLSGVQAALLAVQRQLTGFWLLSVGIVWGYYPKMTLFFIFLYILGYMATSGGARSGIFLVGGIIVTIWLKSKRRLRLRHLALVGILFVGGLLVADYLLAGRSGIQATGSIPERLVRALEMDFAYGGKGIDFAMHSRPPSFETGINYILRLVYLPIPRMLWTSKPTIDPNWEMTEHYYGAPIERIGTIVLLTPIAEALFYFGYIGLIIIPLFYGIVASWLERLYSTSPAFWGLLAQVYTWALLGMRHTFWNLFGALVVANLAMIASLFVVKSLNYGRFSRKFVKKREPELKRYLGPATLQENQGPDVT